MLLETTDYRNKTQTSDTKSSITPFFNHTVSSTFPTEPKGSQQNGTSVESIVQALRNVTMGNGSNSSANNSSIPVESFIPNPRVRREEEAEENTVASKTSPEQHAHQLESSTSPKVQQITNTSTKTENSTISEKESVKRANFIVVNLNTTTEEAIPFNHRVEDSSDDSVGVEKQVFEENESSSSKSQTSTSSSEGSSSKLLSKTTQESSQSHNMTERVQPAEQNKSETPKRNITITKRNHKELNVTSLMEAHTEQKQIAASSDSDTQESIQNKSIDSDLDLTTLPPSNETSKLEQNMTKSREKLSLQDPTDDKIKTEQSKDDREAVPLNQKEHNPHTENREEMKIPLSTTDTKMATSSEENIKKERAIENAKTKNIVSAKILKEEQNDNESIDPDETKSQELISSKSEQSKIQSSTESDEYWEIIKEEKKKRHKENNEIEVESESDSFQKEIHNYQNEQSTTNDEGSKEASFSNESSKTESKAVETKSFIEESASNIEERSVENLKTTQMEKESITEDSHGVLQEEHKNSEEGLEEEKEEKLVEKKRLKNEAEAEIDRQLQEIEEKMKQDEIELKKQEEEEIKEAAARAAAKAKKLELKKKHEREAEQKQSAIHARAQMAETATRVAKSSQTSPSHPYHISTPHIFLLIALAALIAVAIMTVKELRSRKDKREKGKKDDEDSLAADINLTEEKMKNEREARGNTDKRQPTGTKNSWNTEESPKKDKTKYSKQKDESEEPEDLEKQLDAAAKAEWDEWNDW